MIGTALNRPGIVFLLCWLVLFVLYLPAAQAGRVGDFPGWVHFLNSVKFTDYINRSDSGIPSMYQFTQIVTYIFYKAFGANAWLWHLLFITMQAINGLLLFVFFRRLFVHASVRHAPLAALSGVLLFCVCPHISEVIVWESAFHYLLGLMLMLVVLWCTQSFILTQKAKYALWGGIAFLLSTFSLEVFYLTPVFTASLILYYRLATPSTNKELTRNILYFTLPQIIFFGLHFALLFARYHGGVAHITGSSLELNVENLSKGPKYIFHILFFGRYFNDHWRTEIYALCMSGAGLAAFYGLISLFATYIVFKFGQLKPALKCLSLVFLWTMAALALILPLWFQEKGLVIYDRYSYVLDAYIYMLVALLLVLVLPRYVFAGVVVLFALINMRFTHKVNAYWQQSARIVNHLVSSFPNDPTKKVLLLNLPECLDGVQMIGTRDDGEFRMMYNAIMPEKITNTVYDVEAYYMRGPNDGAQVIVANDSTVRVTMNQWGTWWLYYGFGATSYENSDYKVIMRDVGHWYDLVLKHPASEYLLLYSVGGDWKKVDWNKKNIDQY